MPALPEHAALLAPTMLWEDQEELYAASGMQPFEALATSIMVSQRGYSAFLGDEILAIFGVAPRPDVTIVDPAGIVWMISSDGVKRHAIAVALVAREVLGIFMKHHGSLRNFVDARNLRALRFVAWLGFKVGPAQPFGAFGMPFHPITLEA